MHPDTAAYLNNLNRQFYETVADAFDQTRGNAWPGWAHLLPHLPQRQPLRVLDVGCGNGRFGAFLAEFGYRAEYTGIDSSAALLAHAAQGLASTPLASVTLHQQDIIEQPITHGEYDLIAVFGVMHHIPGAQQRQGFIRDLGQRLSVGGVLVYTSWRFMEDARLRARVVPWPAEWVPQVEADDYLLDWRQGATALRYCHAMGDEEQSHIDAASGLHLRERYRADGASGTLNAYSVLQK